MTLPAITPLPPAPARSDAPNDFSAKADAFAAALPGLVNELNEAAGFIDQRAADAQQSAQAALNAVAVAGSAEGLPALAGNAGKVLRINTQENAVFWDEAAPPASAGTPGLVALATPEEAVAGTDPAKAIVSAVLAAVLAGYARLDSPTFSGAPKVPTPAAGDDSLRAANTAFVQASLRAAIATLVNQSPAALDTLNELAAALGNDPHFATTVLTALAGKQPLSDNLTALAGLAGVEDQLPYFTAAGEMALAAFSAFARTLAGSADDLAARTALGACGISEPTTLTLSGTAQDIPNVPAWVKRITINFNGASTTGGSRVTVRVGSGGVVQNTGYQAACSGGGQAIFNVTSGFPIQITAAGEIRKGTMTLTKSGPNVWTCEHIVSNMNNSVSTGSGDVTLLGALDIFRITTENGTDQFDLGSISYLFEG